PLALPKYEPRFNPCSLRSQGLRRMCLRHTLRCWIPLALPNIPQFRRKESLISKELILINPCVSNLAVRLALLFYKQKIDIALLILAGLTPKDYRVRIFNQKYFWRKKDFPKGALVGITCLTHSSPVAYRLADRYKKAGCAVVMGGAHASALPEEALGHCDSVVVGEAESVWPQVMRDFEKGELKKIYQGQPLEDFLSPVFDYFMQLPPRTLYVSGINISRGCKYNCEFCSRPPGKLRFAKIEQAIKLINRMKEGAIGLPGQRPWIGMTQENNIFSDPAYAKKLFKAMVPCKISWAGLSSVDIAFDDEALVLAKESGCRMLYLGFESIHPQSFAKTDLAQIHSLEDYLKAIKKVKSYGIAVMGSFIFGFDDYTRRDYLRLLWFFIRARLYCIPVAMLTPFPGTALFERLKKEDRILTTDWSKYDIVFHVVYRPKHMSRVELTLWFAVGGIVGFVFSLQGLLLTIGLFVGLMIGDAVVGDLKFRFSIWWFVRNL
ncbi:MAG: radical SAM protein, partial [Candidatus Omnitrophota bacterium]